MSWQQQIIEQYGAEYVFRQLAEEASELCQAALKLVRVMREETPLKWSDAQNHLLEEIADVNVMLDMVTGHMLSPEARLVIDRIYAEKQKRMKTRMLENRV